MNGCKVVTPNDLDWCSPCKSCFQLILTQRPSDTDSSRVTTVHFEASVMLVCMHVAWRTAGMISI